MADERGVETLSRDPVPVRVAARIRCVIVPTTELCTEQSSMGKLCLALALPGFLRLLGFATEPLLSSAEIHAIEGEPARINRPVPDPEHLSVVTWNIERGQQYESIFESLRGLDADVLLLQEVDRHVHRTGYRDIARDLAHALDLNWVSGGEFQEIGEGRRNRPATTGQAILSKVRITDAEVLTFEAQAKWRWSINPVQPRRGGRIALKARTAGVLLYNVHIESGGDDSLQRRQVAEVLLDQMRETSSANGPVLIGGDFNNGPLLRSTMFQSLSVADFTDALGSRDTRGPTAFGQRHPIDWIFLRNARGVHGRIVDTKSASDHFAVFAAVGPLASIASLAR
jgi:endonuclease/exonuclease/phosphatase family metal-dependent hydrolase